MLFKELTLLVAWIGLAVADALITVRQLRKLGLQAELNPLIKFLGAKLGIVNGVALGVGLPAIAVSILFFNYPTVLALFVGMRVMLSLGQIVALRAKTS